MMGIARAWPLAAALTALGCGPAPPPQIIPATCNGATELCGRRFDQVSYPTTHNAMATLDKNWGAPNQQHGVPTQLRDGVRGLLLDLYNFEGQVQLCHGTCALGSQPLVEGLTEIRQFLDGNRGEVLTISFEVHDVTAAEVKDSFEASGLARYLHAQPATASWPTLRRMIDEDHRLVVFTDSQGGAYDWYHATYTYTWETPYHFEKASDFTCAVDRGVTSNALYAVNHFLTAPLASQRLAEQVNHNPLLVQRMLQCSKESGRLPNYVQVDYYEIGDLLAAVRVLNGLEAAP